MLTANNANLLDLRYLNFFCVHWVEKKCMRHDLLLQEMHSTMRIICLFLNTVRMDFPKDQHYLSFTFARAEFEFHIFILEPSL